MPKGWGGWEKGYKLKKKGGGVEMVFCLIGANRKLSFNNRSKNCTCKYDQAWPWVWYLRPWPTSHDIVH